MLYRAKAQGNLSASERNLEHEHSHPYESLFDDTSPSEYRMAVNNSLLQSCSTIVISLSSTCFFPFVLTRPMLVLSVKIPRNIGLHDMPGFQAWWARSFLGTLLLQLDTTRACQPRQRLCPLAYINGSRLGHA